MKKKSLISILTIIKNLPITDKHSPFKSVRVGVNCTPRFCVLNKTRWKESDLKSRVHQLSPFDQLEGSGGAGGVGGSEGRRG